MPNFIKSCNVAIVTYSTIKNYDKGDKIHAYEINKHNYEYYRAHLNLQCPGCGAKVVIAHKPNSENHFLFRAAQHHKDDNCPYNHGNATEGTLNITTKTKFAFNSIFFGEEKNSKKRTGGHVDSTEDEDDDTYDVDVSYRLKEKEQPISDLHVMYKISETSPLDSYIDKYNIGRFFITKRTIESGTIFNYNGIHFFAAVACNPTKVTFILKQNNLLPHNNRYFILACENFYGKKPEELYILLIFSSARLYDKFLTKFLKIRDQITKSRADEVLKVFVANPYFKEIHRADKIRILKVEIRNSKQFKIEKVQKD